MNMSEESESIEELYDNALNEAYRRIENYRQAELSGEFVLDLCGLGLPMVPPEVCQLRAHEA